VLLERDDRVARRGPEDAIDRQVGPALLVELALDDLHRFTRRAGMEADDELRPGGVADDPGGAQAPGRLERLDRVAGGGTEDAIHRDGAAVRPEQALDGPDVRAPVAQALVRERGGGQPRG